MRSLLLSLSLLLPATAFAQGVSIHHEYLRASGPMARAAAVFMVIHNDTDTDVVLVSAETDAARTVELHTHIMENDVAKMREIEGGITIPAGGMHELKRGADHVMLMGLTGKITQGDMIPMTLFFDGAEPITLEVQVDNERVPKDGHGSADHSNHN